jgi:hypothetical protein
MDSMTQRDKSFQLKAQGTVVHSKLLDVNLGRSHCASPSQLVVSPSAQLILGTADRIFSIHRSTVAAQDHDEHKSQWTLESNAFEISRFTSVTASQQFIPVKHQVEDMKFAGNGDFSWVDSYGNISLMNSSVFDRFVRDESFEFASSMTALVIPPEKFKCRENSWHGIQHLSSDSREICSVSYFGRYLNYYRDGNFVFGAGIAGNPTSISKIDESSVLIAESRNIQIWDVRSGKLSHRIKASKGLIHSADFGRNLLVCGGEDRNISFADVRNLSKWHQCSISTKYDITKLLLSRDQSGVCFVCSLDFEVCGVSLLSGDGDDSIVGRKRNRLESAGVGMDGYRGDSCWIGLDIGVAGEMHGICQSGSYYEIKLQ